MNSSQQCFLCILDKGENFQPDHAALLSILRNEGVSAAGLGSMTPKSKPYNFLVSCLLLRCWFIVILYLTILMWRIFRVFKNHLCIFRWCSCLQPQRVSVMKSRQKAGPTAGMCTQSYIHTDIKVVAKPFHNDWVTLVSHRQTSTLLFSDVLLLEKSLTEPIIVS